MPFKIVSENKPKGDQPQAIKKLIEGLDKRKQSQVLLGVTGSGKTFTIANVIEKYNRPTLIMAPNKTLAAQLYEELKILFPENAVEYFVSYYDYYQPEAYVPRSDTFIEKESSINEQIDRFRHSATRSLVEREDVIIVASVSCIYGIGSVDSYSKMTLEIKKGKKVEGCNVVQDDFMLATAADIVADPSAPDAFVQGIMEGKEWVFVNGRWTEQDIEQSQAIINRASSGELEEQKMIVWDNFLQKLSKY